MADVTLTAALRSNLLSLQGTQRLLDSTQLKLATGKKVNSALDNANSFFASQALSNRASDLGNLLDGIGQGIQVIKQADAAISSMTKLLNQAQAIAQEARDQAKGGAVVTGGNVANATANSLTGGTFTLKVGSGAVTTFTVAAGDSLSDVAAQINNISGIKATVEEGTAASTQRLRLQTTNGESITLAEGASGTQGAEAFGAGALTTTAATATAPADQTSLQASYNEVLEQIDSLVGDASYRGTNLLDSGNLTVKFNEDGSSDLTITGVDFTSSGLGISLASGATDFSTIAKIDAQIDTIKAALDTARAQSRAFGSNLTIIQTREDFTSSMINTLKEGSDKLVLADQNEEGAKLLSLQTQQSLGVTSLSLASQASQSVLRLFG